MIDHSFFPHPERPVLVIGAAGLDIVGRPAEPLAFGISNPSEIRELFGGVARNVSENLSRLGQPTVLVTAVGQDGTGSLLLDQSRAAGIDVSHVLHVPEKPTGSYLAVVDKKGRLQVALDDMRIMSALTPEFLESKSDLFGLASLVFFDSKFVKTSHPKNIFPRQTGKYSCLWGSNLYQAGGSPHPISAALENRYTQRI